MRSPVWAERKYNALRGAQPHLSSRVAQITRWKVDDRFEERLQQIYGTEFWSNYKWADDANGASGRVEIHNNIMLLKNIAEFFKF